MTTALVIALQVFAAIYFVGDSFADVTQNTGQGSKAEPVLESIVALALVAGIVLGFREFLASLEQSRRQERALAIARGELADLITQRFEEWGLTTGEREVALFALKGCDVAEIARLRGAAPGTIRAQLSQVYAKAGVGSQAMLVSLFFEDLLGTGITPNQASIVSQFR
ncbi:MAG: hypothetical protein EBR34_08515 [Sphingomonadaceae bacterium]|nr:hypothetical protein [Sphingomonadaceae bacterium]